MGEAKDGNWEVFKLFSGTFFATDKRTHFDVMVDLVSSGAN